MLLCFLGRVGMWFTASLPGGVGAALVLRLIPGLLCFVLPPIYRSQQPRHYAFPVFLLLLWVADLLSLLPYTSAWPGRTTTGLYLVIYVMIAMLTIIGGRVVPNFTRGALRAQDGEERGKVEGYRQRVDDRRDRGERVAGNRAARLASLAGGGAQVG